jgi:hypothetical protein
VALIDATATHLDVVRGAEADMADADAAGFCRIHVCSLEKLRTIRSRPHYTFRTRISVACIKQGA